MSSDHESAMVTLSDKIPIPVHAGCKYIGRILGPHGISVKQLEAQTDCTILVCGKGAAKVISFILYVMFRIIWHALSANYVFKDCFQPNSNK